MDDTQTHNRNNSKPIIMRYYIDINTNTTVIFATCAKIIKQINRVKDNAFISLVMDSIFQSLIGNDFNTAWPVEANKHCLIVFLRCPGMEIL